MDTVVQQGAGGAPPPAPRRAHGRSLGDFGKLNRQELRLIEASRRGEPCVLGANRPASGTGKVRVAASLVRFLALGGDDAAPVHERGVVLEGAWLEGRLDLGDCSLARPLILRRCRIEAVEADDAQLPGLGIEDCHLERGFDGYRLTCRGILSLSGKDFLSSGKVGLDGADIGDLRCDGGRFEATQPDPQNPDPLSIALDLSGAKIHGSVFLNNDFHATGVVSLNDADIGGNLDCGGGKFDNPDGDALRCERIKVAADVLLSDNFQANGLVSLAAARIGGSLKWSGGSFESKPGSFALRCPLARVQGAFFAYGLRSIKGDVDLWAMNVGELNDDDACWKRIEGKLVLDGFGYSRISGEGSPTSATERIEWLELQLRFHAPTEFRPQPWEQLISVLRVMGHPGEARRVAMAKARYMLAAERRRWAPLPSRRQRPLAASYYWLADRSAWSLKWLYGKLIGFGYAPTRLFFCMVLVWLVFSLGFLWASGASPYGPSCPQFTASKPQAETDKTAGAQVTPPTPPAPGPGGTPGAVQPAPAPATPAEACPPLQFNPWLYSLDTLVPIDLGYQSDFKPIDKDWGGTVRGMVVAETTLGWLAFGLLIAALTSLIKKD